MVNTYEDYNYIIHLVLQMYINLFTNILVNNFTARMAFEQTRIRIVMQITIVTYIFQQINKSLL